MSASTSASRILRIVRAGLGTAACFATTAAFAFTAWTVVFRMRVGPVIAVIDEHRARGVHAGDIVVLPLLLMAGLLFHTGLVLAQETVTNRGLEPN